ncbi:MAG TPA: VTT domain-containing protein [Patescibacteria group bacterium]|nr:VTT domain-containing protein [Patescibacteria group bacterium]
MDINLLLNTITILFEKFGFLFIFLGSLIEITPLGWAVPGGVILLIAGYLSNGNSNLPFIPIILYGSLGAWMAFVFAYFLGNRSGMWLVKKLHQEKNAEFAKRMLKSNGPAILTTSMLANLTRFWISYIAGVEKYNFLKFNIYAYVASVTWVSLMTILGFLAGYEKENLKRIIGGVGILAWIFLGIAIFVIIKSIRHEYHHFKKDVPHDEKT